MVRERQTDARVQASERVNGWVATVGLAALLSVELATGKSVLSYHTPAILLVQVYFVAAATTLFVKYEKERISAPMSSDGAQSGRCGCLDGGFK